MLQQAVPQNSLLESFPPDVRSGLSVDDRPLKSHDVLIKADEQSRWVYFPHRGTVVSLTRTVESGATVEVGIIGSEGVVGIQNLISKRPAGSDAIVQVAGSGSRVPFAQIRGLLDENANIRDLLLTAAMSFLSQVSQHAVCNRLHTVEQRLAKWLLGVQDRIDSDYVELTHDFLSHMLGIRRAAVTVAIGALTLDGTIAHRRNRITVLDREGLENSSCECYRAMHDAMEM
jgi:CRP-like cAMP-binding protein